MLATTLLLTALGAAPSSADSASPRAVPVPRVEGAASAVDGRLEETVWRGAAVLRGFSQYLPVDGRPSGDSTVVLVWYEPTAIHFGIRAYQDSASVRATLADRDRISGDDQVLLLLDTFNDRRQALLFGVNPLGVQADGTLQDAARGNASIMSAGATGAYSVDLSPDFVYESRGRLTSWGFEVEVRIPFKTLRYQPRAVQDWGLNVVRRVQATGHEHTWTPVLQSEASFLAQGGALAGLTDLRRGLVLDVTPEMTSSLEGARAPSGWEYGGGRPEGGATVRWGITNNLTLNGTANPDFSQVEADVAQLVFDPRDALYFPEKRPFFLDGLELFRTPVQLIYTRRLVDPVAAIKLGGKVGATTVAFLSGLDSREVSATGDDHPFLNALRLRRDVGSRSTLGLTYTDRVDGDRFNRVGAVDGRLGLPGRWTLTFQAGGSATRTTGETVWAPFWLANLNRVGRHWSLALATNGRHEGFRASSGYVSRVGSAYISVSPGYTHQGARGSLVESWNANILLDARWDYHRLRAGDEPTDRRVHLNAGFTLRGGWQIGSTLMVESFGYPEVLYRGYAIERSAGAVVDTIPFTGTERLSNLDLSVNLATPSFRNFAATLFWIVGKDDNFYEWSPADISIGTLELLWRPTEQVRVGLLYNHQQYNRRSDGSLVGLRRVPRLKVEYQLSRSVFVRFVGQYDAEEQDSLRDDSRTMFPILVYDPSSRGYVRAAAAARNDLRVDWLFSYRPTPGTVFYAGYGSSLGDQEAFRFRDLGRRSDGFFVKASYLFRF